MKTALVALLAALVVVAAVLAPLWVFALAMVAALIWIRWEVTKCD